MDSIPRNAVIAYINLLTRVLMDLTYNSRDALAALVEIMERHETQEAAIALIMDTERIVQAVLLMMSNPPTMLDGSPVPASVIRDAIRRCRVGI